MLAMQIIKDISYKSGPNGEFLGLKKDMMKDKQLMIYFKE
jgi:hypothetical protein